MQSSVGDDDAFYPGEDPNSPEVLRVRQEQAYRSVGALQLRVEELTLEVTKVRKKGRKEGRKEGILFRCSQSLVGASSNLKG